MSADRCPCSGVEYEPRFVEVRMARPDGEPLVLTRVPQGVCPNCGSRVYAASVLHRLETVFRETVTAQSDQAGSA